MSDHEAEEVDARALDAFEKWLKSLATDAKTLGESLSSAETSEPAKRALAAGLNYLFKSLDLIDDGIESLGFLDDALVLRLSAQRALRSGAPLGEDAAALAADSALIADVLGDQAALLEKFVVGLEEVTVRGRSPEAIATSEETREELLGELSGWAARYEPPVFLKDEKNLVKLRAFLGAKLPT
jgi:uncharacterized membrane protein YkvA (DUF1232 family)